MTQKNIDDVEENEILAQPVTDGSGNVLVHEGVPITRTLMRVLKRRGVSTVEIRDEATQSAIEADLPPMRVGDDVVTRQKIENMRERLIMAFAPHVENVTMAVLYKSTLDFLTQKYENAAGSQEG